MQHPTRLAALAVFLAVALHAQPSLDNARRAQALLGPDVWSRIIRVENSSRTGVYPRVVHALVFEFVGLLWFYTDVNGTQSFSIHRDNLAQEKADFAPLLRDIEPGFVRWTEVRPKGPAPALAGGAELKNGCFIESVVAWRERMARGAPTEQPRLLSYYSETPRGRVGHTVFAFDAEGVTQVFDPARRGETLQVASAAAPDALALARALEGRGVVKARYLALPAADASSMIARTGAAAPLAVETSGSRDAASADA